MERSRSFSSKDYSKVGNFFCLSTILCILLGVVSEMDELQSKIQKWFRQFQENTLSEVSTQLEATFRHLEKNVHSGASKYPPRRKLSSIYQIVRVKEENEEKEKEQEIRFNYAIADKSPVDPELERQHEESIFSQRRKEESQKELLLGIHTRYEALDDEKSSFMKSVTHITTIDCFFPNSSSYSHRQFNPHEKDDKRSNEDLQVEEDSTSTVNDDLGNNNSDDLQEMLKTIFIQLIQHEQEIQQLKEENRFLKEELLKRNHTNIEPGGEETTVKLD
jgi:uncharacterized coiled-coil protein SlyX